MAEKNGIAKQIKLQDYTLNRKHSYFVNINCKTNHKKIAQMNG